MNGHLPYGKKNAFQPTSRLPIESQLEMLSDWEQTTHFQQFDVQKIPAL